jgi:hypothetical protein
VAFKYIYAVSRDKDPHWLHRLEIKYNTIHTHVGFNHNTQKYMEVSEIPSTILYLGLLGASTALLK